MAQTRSRSRRLSLERLGLLPRRRLRKALRPGLTLSEAALAVFYVLGIVLALDCGTVARLFGGGASAALLQRLVGTVAVVGGLAALGLVYLGRFQRRLVRTRRQLLVFGTCCLVCVAVAKLFLSLDARLAPQWRSLVYLTPLSAFAVLFVVAYGQREAIAAGIVLAMLVGLAVYMDNSAPGGPPSRAASAEPLPVVVVLMAGALVATLASRSIRKRLKLLHVGLLVGLLHVGLLLGLYLLQGRLRLSHPPLELVWGLASGVGVGALMTLMLPLVELLFDVVTDIRLLELSDQDQTLLRALVTLAPSTDNHSRRVARLAEAAAESVGANSLLALVGAYYHDIGKMTKPEYFIENQMGGENPHDRLRPSMSALVIASHVKDGVELAREAKLPQAVVDIIEQHHGTSAIEFFYDRYLKEAGDKPILDATFFRYPGPKPATKEAAIVMIADAIEAASRLLDQPVPSRIEALIQRITAAKLLDGQLEECRLTLSELRSIEQSLFRVLCAMYHARIEYPADRQRRAAGAHAH